LKILVTGTDYRGKSPRLLYLLELDNCPNLIS
jgi:hypothetical protein